MQLFLSAVIWEQFLRSGMCQLELVPLADKYGCAGVEFRPYWKSPLEEMVEIKDFLAEYNMTCTYACNEALLAGTREAVVQSLEAMRKSIDWARRVGAGFLRVNVANETFNPEFIAASWWHDAVGEAVEYARESEVVLVLENAPDPERGRAALLRDIVAAFDSPWLRIAYDTANWIPAGEEPLQALDMLIQYVAYVHLKDIVQHKYGYTFTNPGSGSLDFRAVVDRLEQNGYKGFYVLEFPGENHPAGRVLSSMNYLRREGRGKGQKPGG